MKKLVATFGGVGLLPGMPGTYASLVAAVIYYLLWLGLGNWALLVIAPLMLLASLLSITLWPWSKQHFKHEDPRQFVLDEVAGQWITLLFVPLMAGAAHPYPLALIGAGFFLFRGFDVAKPYPISVLERLPRGWGVLLDDIVAGIFAGVGLWILVLLTRLLAA